MCCEENIRDQNPWAEVAGMYDDKQTDCLYSENMRYVCGFDEADVEKFNGKLRRNDKDRLVINIPAEPWQGNPFKAKLVILSLNPGYVPAVNCTLAKLLQSDDYLRKGIIEFKKKTLLFESGSFLPEENENEFPISVKDAVNMLGDWYWEKKFSSLKNDTKLEDSEFFKQVAIVQYCAYSSITATIAMSFRSQKFTVNLIDYISSCKKDTLFLVLRSVNRWKELFVRYDSNFFASCSDRIIVNTNRSQNITCGNLGEKNYEKICDLLTNSKALINE